MTDEQVFDRAIQLDAENRDDFLDGACETAQQRDRVASLLAAHGQSDSLLDTEAMISAGDTIADRPVHKSIGDFEIIRELGRGGMGVVYEARQKSLKRRVALKVLSSGLGLSSKAILRFRREAEAAGKLHHTNIVPIYITGEDKGIHYYAMELIEGPSLDAVIKDLKQEIREGTEKSEAEADVPSWLQKTALYDATGPARGNNDASSVSSSTTVAQGTKYFDQVATMIAEVADAMEHAHEHGVIHRDIKPSNLLLAPDGRLSINDFGLARMLEQPGMTMSGEFVGSPLYMSPEQITAGRVTIDHRTDIYSLGATLYELLTLQPPFPGQARDQVLSQILHKEAPAPRKLNRKVPVDLDTICMKAIEKDPDRRYQTSALLADDLRRFVNRHAISSRRIGPLGKIMRWTRRNPIAAGAITAVLLVFCIAAGVIMHTRQAQKKTDLDRISNSIFEAVLRGDFNRANILLTEGKDRKASSDWVHFSEGLISLFRSEYGAAKTSLTFVSEDQNKLAAQGLLAVAHMWSGDEEAYFVQLRRLETKSASQFRELLCLGYAHCWGEPRKAVELLDRALELEKNHPFARVIRAQAHRLRAMDLINANEAKVLIEQAIDDIESQRHMVRDVPMVAMETTLVNLAATNIYAKLGMATESERRLVAATEMESILEQFESSPKVPYVLVLLLSHSDPQNVLRLDERWIRRGITPEPHTCNWMGINLLQCGEYEKAQYWLDRRGNTPTGRMWKFLDRYVLLASTARTESLDELRQQAESDLRMNCNEKLVMFDVSQIGLFGGDDSFRSFIRQDTKHTIISDFQLPFDYFAAPPDSRQMSDAELLDKCSEHDRPVFQRMHANFFLGIEALAAGNTEGARRRLEACNRDDGFQFCVYRLSQALLAHQDQWGIWLDERSGLSRRESRRRHIGDEHDQNRAEERRVEK